MQLQPNPHHMKAATTQANALDHIVLVPVRNGRRKVQAKFIPINGRYEGGIPKGYDLVEVQGTNYDEAMVLYGFDEVMHRPGFQIGFLALPQ